ncbi:MAG: proline--tRNA ligase [Patescibacteria group bacterium]
MRYSQFFLKTSKDAKEFDSVNATLLQKGGFIHQTMAGVYTFLPLGLRVLNKIENIVREEMDKLGSELLMPALSPKELWQTTGRLETVDVLFEARGANEASRKKNDASYVLNATHEDVLTPIAQQFRPSYKDLPAAVYQIQTKFRNEPRAKSGLLRGREFRMKDLYSFHASEEDFEDFYEKMKVAYTNTFQRLGIGNDTYVVMASGGSFSKHFSHEFQTRCDTGEDVVFHAMTANVLFNREIAPSHAPPLTQQGEAELPIQEVEGKGLIGVEPLAEYLKIPVEKTTKTILFETQEGEVIAAAVRGTYEINENKLEKIVGKEFRLASPETVKQVTGAEVGYAGLLNLPSEVQIYMDESVKGRKNFETGANRTHYHTINVNFGRDLPEPDQFYDIKVAREGDLHPETGEVYEVFRASEVGNVFRLGTKFTEAFGYTYTDEKGTQQPVLMGSYGIGTSRIMGVLVEKFHDDRGIIWPSQVAPFQVYLAELSADLLVQRAGASAYEQLTKAGIEVLYDDRKNASAGEKLADADLLGILWRLVVSKKTGDKVEVKRRTEDSVEMMGVKEFLRHAF